MSLAQIAKANLLHNKDFVRLYRDHLSDFKRWEHKDHADKYLVFPQNFGTDLSIDEVEIWEHRILILSIISTMNKAQEKGKG